MPETRPGEKRPRSSAPWIFAAGAVAGGFLFYALAWRSGALVPGHWLTLSSRDAFSSRPTPVRPIPTFPFPTPSPLPSPAAAAEAAPAAIAPGVTGPIFATASGSTLPPSSIAPASKPAGSVVLPQSLPVPPLALLLPVVGAHVRDLHDNFDETRGGTRRHEAIDILAPRGSPVVAAVDGRISKLFTSQQGGLTVYEFDSTGEYCYYYAHLDRYAPGLAEGMAVKRGDRIGDVGTTGNAPKNTPHLHFAVFRLGAQKRWWEGEAINPFPMLQKAEER